MGAAPACRTPDAEDDDDDDAVVAAASPATEASRLEAPFELFRPGCFETHLRDAVALNRERKPLYAALSNGATKSLSDRLIVGELAAISVAKVHDTRASFFHRKGLTVLCDELMPMSGAPEFDATLRPPGAPSPLFRSIDPKAMKDDGLAALAGRSFAGAEAFARAQIATLSPDAAYFCMTLHVLESVLRAAVLAPKHAVKAAELGVDPPTSLSRDFISIQIKQIPFSVDLDRDAEALHAQGIPIVCQDVPKIPEG
jgi:hypothetical protein